MTAWGHLRMVGSIAYINDDHCAKTLLYDSVFYSVYLNIHLKYTHQRIEPYTQVRIYSNITDHATFVVA